MTQKYLSGGYKSWLESLPYFMKGKEIMPPHNSLQPVQLDSLSPLWSLRILLCTFSWTQDIFFWLFHHSHRLKLVHYLPNNSLGMFRPWTWAIKDRMSLVVCSALKTWCRPLWMGGRWHLVVVLWRSWVRYWSNMSFEPSGIKYIHAITYSSTLINQIWLKGTQTLCPSLTTWGPTLIIFLSIFFTILLILEQAVIVLFIQEAEASVERSGLETGEVWHLHPVVTFTSKNIHMCKRSNVYCYFTTPM